MLSTTEDDSRQTNNIIHIYTKNWLFYILFCSHIKALKLSPRYPSGLHKYIIGIQRQRRWVEIFINPIGLSHISLRKNFNMFNTQP